MKNIQLIIVGSLAALLGTSCMTTYDAYGRPVQSMDPGAAVAGMATAAIIGYALGNDDDDGHHRHHQRRPAYHHDYCHY